jgi:ABC-type polysaccharide/polyol phosphate export permease
MRGYLKQMWDCRYFWLSLVKMDVRTRYRGSALGLGWSLLQPIAMTFIICFVFHNIFKKPEPISYFGPYVLSGLCCWAFILNAATQGCHCFQLAEIYIRQHPAPMAIYPLRLVLGLGFHFMITLGVVITAAAVMRGIDNPYWLVTILPSLVLIFILGWSLATLTGLATVHFPDSKQITEVTFQALFYLTPVMMTDSILGNGFLAKVYKFNPLYWFYRLLRDPLLAGSPPSLTAYGITTATALIALVFAAWTLRRLEKKLIFHL